MQGVANQRTINAQRSCDYSVSQIKNPKNHQILGWQVSVTEKGQDSSQTGTSAENPAYILQLSNKDENGNEVLTQFYKDNGIDPKNVDQTKLEVQTVDEETDKIARKYFDDTVGKAFLGTIIETQIKGMLNPFNGYQDAEVTFRGASRFFAKYLNDYSNTFGADNSYYKELTEKLDAVDPEHKNSVVSYIKDLINTSASGKRIEYDDNQVKTAGQAFDDCFGGISLGDAKKKGREMNKAFTKALGESSVEKYFGILLKSRSIKEITDDLIKAFNLSTKGEDTSKTATSTPTADVDLLTKQRTSQTTDSESNEQMAILKRNLDKTSVGSVVDVEM